MHTLERTGGVLNPPCSQSVQFSGTWVNNVFVHGKELFTVFPDGTLEIRGPGWDGRKRKGDTEMTDRPRVCKLDSEEEARRIVELIVSFGKGEQA